MVIVRWYCDAQLRSLASEAYDRGDFTHVHMRLHGAAVFAIAEAIVKILTEAGYAAAWAWTWIRDPSGCAHPADTVRRGGR
jgi:hypothetical protein